MTITNPASNNRILDSLPDGIRSALLNYAHEAGLAPQSVIELVIIRFLELDVALLKNRQPSSNDTSLLADLPASLHVPIRQYASDTEVPSEFVIELAIAHFLDPDSVTFDDCRIRVQRNLVEQLKQQARNQAITAA